MIELGKFNELTMVREKQQGVYLTDGSTEEVLLPGSYVPEGARPGTKINVFVYLGLVVISKLNVTCIYKYIA